MESTRHKTLTWRVYQDIVQLISTGRLIPGHRLDEQQLAEELGVSRTPLREAITRLVQDGLIENRPYRGNFVRKFTGKEVYDLYEVRKGLESMAVRLAIPHLTTASVAELRSILAEIDAALKAGDLEAYGMADRHFHESVALLSGNATLISMLDQLGGQIQLIRSMANQSQDVVEITAMERPEIVDAMVDGDTARAAQLMEEHIGLVQRYTVAQLDVSASQSSG